MIYWRAGPSFPLQNDGRDIDAKWVYVVPQVDCSVGGCFAKTKLTAEGLRQPPTLDLTVRFLQCAPYLAWHGKMPASFGPNVMPLGSGRAHGGVGGCSGRSELSLVLPGAAAQGWQQLVLA